MTRTLTIALALAFALIACKSDPPQQTPKTTADAGTKAPKEDPKAQSPTPKAPKKPATLTTGPTWTPEAFAGQWAKIFALPDELPQKDNLGEKLSERWLDKKLKWTGYAVASLCLKKKKRCSVNTFKRTKTLNLTPLGGFFPLVDFTDEGWKKIAEDCADQTQCVITFTGVLTKVTTEPGRPLALTFSDATVQEARQPLADEVWFGRATTTKTDTKPKGELRTGKATPIKFKLKSKTF